MKQKMVLYLKLRCNNISEINEFSVIYDISMILELVPWQSHVAELIKLNLTKLILNFDSEVLLVLNVFVELQS